MYRQPGLPPEWIDDDADNFAIHSLVEVELKDFLSKEQRGPENEPYWRLTYDIDFKFAPNGYDVEVKKRIPGWVSLPRLLTEMWSVYHVRCNRFLYMDKQLHRTQAEPIRVPQTKRPNIVHSYLEFFHRKHEKASKALDLPYIQRK